MLNGGGFQAVADCGEQRLALVALDAIDAHLDEFMRLQSAVDLGKDCVAEAFLADAGNRVQAVGACAHGAALQ